MEQGKEEAAIQWINEHWTDSNPTEEEKANLLFLAIQKFDFKVAYYMIDDEGVNVNCKKSGGSGSTPLHIACVVGNDKMVAKLLENGADPVAEDAKGKTPLHWAVESKHCREPRIRKCVLVLLETMLKRSKKGKA